MSKSEQKIEDKQNREMNSGRMCAVFVKPTVKHAYLYNYFHNMEMRHHNKLTAILGSLTWILRIMAFCRNLPNVALAP